MLFFIPHHAQKSKLCIVLNLPSLHLKEVRLLELMILILIGNISSLISYVLLRFWVHRLTNVRCRCYDYASRFEDSTTNEELLAEDEGFETNVHSNVSFSLF